VNEIDDDSRFVSKAIAQATGVGRMEKDGTVAPDTGRVLLSTRDALRLCGLAAEAIEYRRYKALLRTPVAGLEELQDALTLAAENFEMCADEVRDYKDIRRLGAVLRSHLHALTAGVRKCPYCQGWQAEYESICPACHGTGLVTVLAVNGEQAEAL